MEKLQETKLTTQQSQTSKKQIFKPKKLMNQLLNNSILGLKGNQLDNTQFNGQSNAFVNTRKYYQFQANNILHVESTISSVILLMTNGTICSWGENKSSLGRRVIDSNMDCYQPMVIKCPERIIEFQCGFNHVIVLSTSGTVYTWGNNQFGQLGLIGFKVSIGSERDEPTEVTFLKGIQVRNVFARGNSTFCITAKSNNLYGWGDNRNSQLGFNDIDYVEIPSLIENTTSFSQEFTLVQEKAGRYSEIIFLMKPSNKIQQSMVYFNNKYLSEKEAELSSELKLITDQLKSYNNKKSIKILKSEPSSAKNSLQNIKTFGESLIKKNAELKIKINDEHLKAKNLITGVSITEFSTKPKETNNIDDYLNEILKKAQGNLFSNKETDILNIKDKNDKISQYQEEINFNIKISNLCIEVIQEGELILLKHEEKETNHFPAYLDKVSKKINELNEIKIEVKQNSSLNEVFSTIDSDVAKIEKNSNLLLPSKHKDDLTSKDTDSIFMDKSKEMYKSVLKLKMTNVKLNQMILYYSEKFYNTKLAALIPQFKASKVNISNSNTVVTEK